MPSSIFDIFKKVFTLGRGEPLPLGATPRRNGINFSIFSRHATAVTLTLFAPEEDDALTEIDLDPRYNRTGDIWHIFIRGLDPNVQYGYRMDRLDNEHPTIFRYDPDQVLIDPYTRALSGGANWAQPEDPHAEVKARRRRGIIHESDFDWGDDQPLNIPLSDLIIYELHVRGFTRHESSGVEHPGTFLGLIEKIPYLKELGINAIELMPIYEFDELENDRVNPQTGERLLNYWGYNPICFFASNAAYTAYFKPGQQIKEFKTMVKAMHEAGIEVILDVVFNHTAEGDERGHTFSFRGIDNPIYYLIDPETGAYANYSGCGNTVNCNHPVVRDMIINCLHYWVTEMHVDGFRFDLASIMGRGQDGEVLANPPLIERIAADPILANTKLIAEAWDAAGLYQVGTFPAWGRWAEWNGKFRDDIRQFVKSDPGLVTALAQRLIGSPDLYSTSGRNPYHSINFMTSHDGFTLHDLVSYNEKHNEANGEDNRDGADDDFSWNCGVEGPTDASSVQTLRQRQMKNFATLLLMAHGVPMILAGDEFGRTQQGNNNAYCQDNDISWVDWKLANENEELLRFFKKLIDFRHKHPALRRKSYVERHDQADIEIYFHGVKLSQPDWSFDSRSLAVHFSTRNQATGNQPEQAIDIYIIANAFWEALEFELPSLNHGVRWHRFVDTWLAPPNDITVENDLIHLDDQDLYWVGPRTVVVLVGK